MSQLFEQLLKAHQQSVSTGSIVNISTELDREVISIYQKARIEMEKRLKGKNGDSNQQKKVLNAILFARLSQLLSTMDLLNSAKYDTLTHAIKNWCPWQVEDQRSCLLVQNILLKLLPAARKRQQLDLLCREYQRHLKTEIENQAQNHHEQAYFACSNSNSALFGAPPVANRAQVKLVRDQRSPVEKLIAESNRYIDNSNIELSGAVQKYKIVSQLREALATPIQSASAQIKSFQRIFTAERQVLEKDRDTQSVKFIKGIATVLSLGIAWLCGVWDVKGENTTHNIQTVLDLTPPVSL